MWLRLFLSGLGLASFLLAAKSDLDYLPQNISYLASVPKPEAVLGAPVGEWHVRHDQLVAYMRALAASSDRVHLLETGRTHENRPLLLLAFSHPDNIARLDEIRQAHLASLKPDVARQSAEGSEDDPLVIWMGYSVHGDEPSGSNASMLVAYYLAAGQGDKLDALLANSVILLDPSLNPDGLARFAQWANSHKGKTLSADPQHREHWQAWPSGRTNHYWFDLNRDWLLLTHPESEARVRQFHRWRPHVLTDFHEMGSNSSYFFQPGILSRTNPWTPAENQQLTADLAEFHAQALDNKGQLYFTQESFDDFYYGKGSTYPDALGSIGILFEQASSRGHLNHTENGLLSFSQTIQNQVTTSLSTFDGAMANNGKLRKYALTFYSNTSELIKADKTAGYLLQEVYDKSKFARFISILEQHQIQYQQLGDAFSVGEQNFEAKHSIYVPLDQPAYRLIKSLFSTRTQFENNTFYDVSNWNLALAFDLTFQPVNKKQVKKLSKFLLTSNSSVLKIDESRFLGFEDDKPAQQSNRHKVIAYAIDWRDSAAATALSRLLQQGVKVKVAGEPFTAHIRNTQKTRTTSNHSNKNQPDQQQYRFSRGSAIITVSANAHLDLPELLNQVIADTGLPVLAITTSLTPQGIDLGSNKMDNLSLPNILLVGGVGTSQYEVGEIWHYLDSQLQMPVSVVDLDRLNKAYLAPYTHIIFAQGSYQSVSKASLQALSEWLDKGGVLIGQKSAGEWFSQQQWLKADYQDKQLIADAISSEGLAFADKESWKAKQRIAGAVFATRLDTSHPLGFGYSDDKLPVFRNSTRIMKVPETPFITPIQYQASPLLAGYAAEQITALIANSAGAIAHSSGDGKVIVFNDNINFRGYWRGTSRLMANSLFMSSFIE